MSIILIVDDQEVNLQILELMTRRTCCDAIVVKAGNGEEAVSLYKELTKNGYNIRQVITDFHMPKMDGGELSKTLRKLGYDKLIVMLTSDENIEQVNYPDVNRVFYKPLTRKLINEILEY